MRYLTSAIVLSLLVLSPLPSRCANVGRVQPAFGVLSAPPSPIIGRIPLVLRGADAMTLSPGQRPLFLQASPAPLVEPVAPAAPVLQSVSGLIDRIAAPQPQEKDDTSRTELSTLYDGTKGPVKSPDSAVAGRVQGFVSSLLRPKGSAADKRKAPEVPPTPGTPARGTLLALGLAPVGLGAFLGLIGAMAGLLASMPVAALLDAVKKDGLTMKAFNATLIAGGVIGFVTAALGAVLGPGYFTAAMLTIAAVFFLSVAAAALAPLVKHILKGDPKAPSKKP